MANIDQTLPSGRAILNDPGADAGAYGEHLVWAREPGRVVLSTHEGEALALFDGVTYSVDLRGLDRLNGTAPKIVAYVNAFLDGEQRVEKYWRTKAYRIVGQPAPQPQAIVQHVAPTVVATPVVATPQPAPSGEIAGVEHPKRQSIKRYRKGWSKVGDIVVKDGDLDTLNDAWALRQTGVPASVLITGPAGTAKTALVRAFAASLGVPFLKVDGGAIRTADDWAGSFKQDPATRTWAHRWSPFAQVLRKGEPCVVLVDEITRTESPQALNAFMGLLDWTGALLVPDAGEVLRLPAGVLVVATANIGPEFVGTLPLDGAVRQRFPNGIRMAYPPEDIEADILADLTGVEKDVAVRLVTMAVTQRANRMDPQMYPSGSVISTRVLLDIARRITTCAREPRAAALSVLSGQFDPEDEAALSVAVDTQFPAVVFTDDEVLNEADAPADGTPASPWSCPACGRENHDSTVVCWGHDCTYVRTVTPSGGIRLQNTTYQP